MRSIEGFGSLDWTKPDRSTKVPLSINVVITATAPTVLTADVPIVYVKLVVKMMCDDDCIVVWLENVLLELSGISRLRVPV